MERCIERNALQAQSDLLIGLITVGEDNLSVLSLHLGRNQ